MSEENVKGQETVSEETTVTGEEVQDEVIDESKVETQEETQEETKEESAEIENKEGVKETSEDDPFAEFENTGVKDKPFYENLFKTDDKLKHTPNIARDLIYAEVEKREESEKFISELGGRETLEVTKPLISLATNPNPSTEEVEAAFDLFDTHNPKVMEVLGTNFTKTWVDAVIENPLENLSPLVQNVFKQEFGADGADYDLAKIAAIVQLCIAKDEDGDPLIDLELAKQQFEAMGGRTAFKYQQEIAQLKRGQNGQTKPKTEPVEQKTQAEIDVESDLVGEHLPKVENLLTRLGFDKTHPQFQQTVDAFKYRLSKAQETANIRNFAKNGQYKTADGNFTLAVGNNRKFVGDRLMAQIVGELKVIQNERRGKSFAKPKEEVKDIETKEAETRQEQKSTNGKPAKNFDGTMNNIQAELRNKFRDRGAAWQIAKNK